MGHAGLRSGRTRDFCPGQHKVEPVCSLPSGWKQLNTEHTCTRAWDGGSRNDSFHWLECLLLLIYSTGILEASALPLCLPLPLKHTQGNRPPVITSSHHSRILNNSYEEISLATAYGVFLLKNKNKTEPTMALENDRVLFCNCYLH